jgi:hypothetical protein
MFDPAAPSKEMFPPEIANALAKNDVAGLEPFFNKLQENTTQRVGLTIWNAALKARKKPPDIDFFPSPRIQIWDDSKC